MRAALGEAAGIESDHAIGFPQPLDHLGNHDLDQQAMIPWCGADEVLDDLALDIDQGRNLLGILAVDVRQQALEVEVYVALAGLGPQGVLIGHHEVAQTLHHGGEHVGGYDTVPHQFRAPLCPWSRRTASVLPLSSGIPPSAPRTGQVAFTTSGGPIPAASAFS